MDHSEGFRETEPKRVKVPVMGRRPQPIPPGTVVVTPADIKPVELVDDPQGWNVTPAEARKRAAVTALNLAQGDPQYFKPGVAVRALTRKAGKVMQPKARPKKKVRRDMAKASRKINREK